MAFAPPLQFSDEQGGALPTLAEWVQSVLLGQAGTAVAVLAVAGVGFALLQGRLAVREGIRVVLGCFILFAAPLIARGLANAAREVSGPELQIVLPPPPRAEATPKQEPSTNPFDPYAGAAVPM